VQRPNILYLHSHDTGRHIEPYGHQVPTPSMQRLAEQGVLFRAAFSAASSCSGSRAALLTGETPHSNGMIGLAHRGFSLRDPSHHLVNTLREAGYWSALVGEQHVSEHPEELGYDVVVRGDSTRVDTVAPAAVEILRDLPPQPFFLSVGFFETHREYFEPTSERDALHSLPPENLPDTRETRRDMASYKASARQLDKGVGTVLDALDERGLAGETLVILTTDHGLAFPGAKATLYDRGIGVLLIMRGPGGFQGGRVSDALVSQLDLFPTICELAGAPVPERTQGRSLLGLLREDGGEVNEQIFAELTYHAAYEPQRAVRTKRWKYIRRFGDRELPVLANVDDSPSKDVLIDAGWAERPLPREELHDLLLDPAELQDLAPAATHAGVLEDMRSRLAEWMRATADPLLRGDVPAPAGAVVSGPEQRSPAGVAAPEPEGSPR
jgi:arylsulfatase A-like enzyme